MLIDSFNIFNVSNITPKESGCEEKEEFKLPNDSLPAIYYIALKAIDKSKNEGKLSNIVQAVIKQEPVDGNLNKSDTKDITETITTDPENVKTGNINWYAVVAGSTSGVILLIILINALIWTLYFRKYKRNNQASKISYSHKSSQLYKTGKDLNSDENILRSEYEGNQTNETGDREILAINNPPDMYAKVRKKDKTQEPAEFDLNNSETLSTSRQLTNLKETDLGFV